FEMRWDMRKRTPRPPAAAGPSKRRVSILSQVLNGKSQVCAFPFALDGICSVAAAGAWRTGWRRRASRGRLPHVLGDQPRHHVRFLDVRQMARALNALKARAFDERSGFPYDGYRDGAVLVADQAKGRRSN